jgi:hypothetical protein
MSSTKRGMAAAVAIGMIVAVAIAVVLMLAVARRDARPSLATSAPPGGAPLVDPGDIVAGGPPPDGIPPVDWPRFQAASAVDWLAAAEPVAMVELGGDAKAYPLQILVWHEIVNDQVGGVPVAVTYCPLCNTAITFRRPMVAGKPTTFGTSGRLYHSNLVMYDRATGSLWPQALGIAVTGELTGQRLQRVATQLVAWRDFRAAFPGSRVLSRDTGHRRPYGQNPYPLYDRKGTQPFLFDGRPDGRLEAVERVLGVSQGDRHLAVPYTRLAEQAQGGVAAANLELGGAPMLVLWRSGVTSALDRRSIAASRDVGAAAAFSRRVGDRPLTFHADHGRIRDRQTGSTWDQFGRATAGSLTGTRLAPVTAMDSFWFDWAAFHPDTAIWAGSSALGGQSILDQFGQSNATVETRPVHRGNRDHRRWSSSSSPTRWVFAHRQAGRPGSWNAIRCLEGRADDRLGAGPDGRGRPGRTGRRAARGSRWPAATRAPLTDGRHSVGRSASCSGPRPGTSGEAPQHRALGCRGQRLVGGCRRCQATAWRWWR